VREFFFRKEEEVEGKMEERELQVLKKLAKRLWKRSGNIDNEQET
jgi:hypothetical protein